MNTKWTKLAVAAVVFSTCASSRAAQIEYSIADPVVTQSAAKSVTWKEVLSGRVVPLSIKGREMNASWHSFKSRKDLVAKSNKKANSAAVQTKLRSESISRLKQIMTGVLMYESDEGKFPPMQNMRVLKKTLKPYVEDNEIFTQPDNGRPYVINVFLSGKDEKIIASHLTMAVIYEATVSSDGKRAVAFADGHVQRVTQSEWTKIKKVSKIK